MQLLKNSLFTTEYIPSTMIIYLVLILFSFPLVNMLSNLLHAVGAGAGSGAGLKLKGSVVLKKKSGLIASFLDWIPELLGKGVSLQLISAEHGDPANGSKGKVGNPAYLKNWSFTDLSLTAGGESKFNVEFDWDDEFGKPGAVLVKNNHHNEFYLKTVTLDHVPGHGRVHFVCNSWVYPSNKNNKDRVFFTNKTYLPHEMPELLTKYRNEELKALRGNGEGELQEGDRVYDYAYYNDLGDPDEGPERARPVLGGSAKYPYPRRGRTGRPPTKSDANTESRKWNGSIYVPRDEHFDREKKSDFDYDKWRGKIQSIIAYFESCVKDIDKFESFKNVNDLYDDELNVIDWILPKYPVPQLIKVDQSAWRTDEEFAREMLAGLNPVVIRRLEEFPSNSSIKQEHIEFNLDGLKVKEALESKRLFILDHHDTVIPYIYKINEDTETRTYASRTLLFLKDDGTLKPVAIELSKPVPVGDKEDKFVVESKVYTPAEHGVEGSIWQLAKAYVAVVDTGYHQLISHWLNTHATIEPFVIATHRQLSAVHPIYKLLHPHFRDTMAINALAREELINAGGIIEQAFYPGKYSMEMSSVIYKNWNFLDQALPRDLKKRRMTDGDINSLDDLNKLLIKDYPYAVDGLKIWFAFEKWVRVYCSFYYKTNEMVRQDPELQAWWKELREVGHGDKKEEPWWPKMETLEELIESCTIIIWVASALHAAVNFGQYAYAGYFLNRPTLSRKFMPEKGTQDYENLKTNFEKVFLETITPKRQCLIGLTALEILSKHSSDEKYLGDRDDDPENWTTDPEPKEALEAFKERLAEIANEITNMNEEYRNRFGPVNVPYTLLSPKREVGLTGMGIPNSISI